MILTNDPTSPSKMSMDCVIEDYANIGALSVVLPGVRIGTRALVAAQACVGKGVLGDMVVAAVPARVLGKTSTIKLRDGFGRSAYPWTQHFTRGFLAEIANDCGSDCEEQA